MTDILNEPVQQEKEPSEFLFSFDAFMEMWNKHKPELDYDPDVFPKRFTYDVRLVKHMMITEHYEKVKSSNE